MAASLKRLEEEIEDEENTSEEYETTESEVSEDVYPLSTTSASTTRSDDEEKSTPVTKKKSSKKSKKNVELPEDASGASALPTSSNNEKNSSSGNKLKSILKTSKKNDENSKTESNECPVCLGPIIYPVRTPCGHVFCFLCVKGAARQANKCPMCRQHIPIDFNKNPVILEHHEVETFEDGHQWFYEGKNGWWQYDKRTSNEIEHRYKLNILKFDVLICGTMYTIDLDRSVQYNRDNPNRKRKVKRENANNIAVKGVAGVY